MYILNLKQYGMILYFFGTTHFSNQYGYLLSFQECFLFNGYFCLIVVEILDLPLICVLFLLQVLGCGGAGTREAQQEQKQWESREAQRSKDRKVTYLQAINGA